MSILEGKWLFKIHTGTYWNLIDSNLPNTHSLTLWKILIKSEFCVATLLSSNLDNKQRYKVEVQMHTESLFVFIWETISRYSLWWNI